MSELVTPSPALLGLVITISSCYAVAMEIVKRLFYGRLPNGEICRD